MNHPWDQYYKTIATINNINLAILELAEQAISEAISVNLPIIRIAPILYDGIIVHFGDGFWMSFDNDGAVALIRNANGLNAWEFSQANVAETIQRIQASLSSKLCSVPKYEGD